MANDRNEDAPRVGADRMTTLEPNMLRPEGVLPTLDQLTIHEHYGAQLAAHAKEANERCDRLHQLNDRLFTLANARFKTRLAQLESRHPMLTTGVQPCAEAEAAVVSCLTATTDDSGRSLQCAQLVEQFRACVGKANKETLLQ